MKRFLFSHRVASHSEKRLIYMSPGNVEKMFDAQEAKHNSNAAVRKRAGDVVGDVDDFMRGDSGNVDKPSARSQAEEKRDSAIDFLIGVSSLSEGARAKALFLRDTYGINFRQDVPYAFGLPDVRIYGVSDRKIARAIALIEGKMNAARGGATFAPPKKVFGESNYDYRTRLIAARQHFDAAAVGVSATAGKDVQEWNVLLDVLIESLKKTAKLKDIRARIDGGEPGAINEVSTDDRNDNPGLYKEMLVDAAITDESVLAGKEELLNIQDFIEVMEEVLEENPAAILYMSDASKGSGKEVQVPDGTPGGTRPESLRDFYRRQMKSSAQEDGAILESFGKREDGAINKEYEKYWLKQDPKGFKKLAISSIHSNPALFFRPDLWRKGKESIMARSMNDMVAEVLSKSSTVIGVLENMGRSNASVLKDYVSPTGGPGFIGFIEMAVYKKGRRPAVADIEKKHINELAMIVIGNNAELLGMVQDKTELYNDIKNLWEKMTPADRAKMLRDTEMKNDEDIMIAELKRIFDLVKFGTPGWERRLQNNYLLFENIPPHVMWTMEYTIDSKVIKVNEMLMKLFTSGDSFKNAPAQWRNDDQIVRALIAKNASIYEFISPRLKSPTQTGKEILLAALTAEARGNGNMFWKDVSPAMKEFLESKGIKGVADLKRLADIVLTGDVQEDEKTPGSVQSPFDDPNIKSRFKKMTPAQRKKAGKALLEKHPTKPEYLLDAPAEVRSDPNIVRNLMQKNPYYFKYIDHDALFTADEDSYKRLVRTAVEKDPTLIGDADARIQEKFDFLVVLAKRDLGTLATLIANLDKDVRTDIVFLTALIKSELFDGDSAGLIKFLETSVLKDEVDGVTLLEVLPLSALFKLDVKNKHTHTQNIVRAYLEMYPDLIENMEVIPSVLLEDENFMNQLLFLKPERFAEINHEYWYEEDIYKVWLKAAYAKDVTMLRKAADEVQSDVDFLAELADEKVTALETVVANIHPRLRTDDFVTKIIALLEGALQEDLKATYIPRISKTLPEAVFDFIEHHVLKGDRKIRSVMQFWPEDLAKDRAHVLGYLRDSGSGHRKPENVQFIHSSLRNDPDFIKILLDEPGYGLDIFPYLDHEEMYATGDFYKDLVIRVIQEKPELYKYANERLTSNVDFLWKASGGDIDKFTRTINRISPRLRADPVFLSSLIDVLKDHAPDSILDYIENTILPDVAYTGTDALNKLLLANNAEILIQLVQENPSFALSERVPAAVLSRGLLEQLVLIVLPTSTSIVRKMLEKAPDAERSAFIQSHPRLILSLFEENSRGLMEFLGEEHITVEMLRHVITNYNTNESLWTLIRAAEVKPRAVEGVLLERPDLYVSAAQWVKDQIFAALGNTAIDAIIEKYDAIDEVDKQKPMRFAKMRLQTARQKLLAVKGLYTQDEVDKISVKWTPSGSSKSQTLTFASVDMDFAEAGDFSDATVELINDMAHQHKLILDALNKFGTIDQIANPDNTLKNDILKPDITIPKGLNVGDTSSQAKQEFLKNTYDRVKDMKIPEDRKKAVLENISKEMRKRFEALRSEMLNTTLSDALRTDKAQKVLWYLETASEIWLPDAPSGLDMQKIRNYRKEAKDVIEQLKALSKPSEVGPPLSEEKEAYYNLTAKQHKFVELIGTAVGTEKFAMALGMSKINKPFLKLQMENITRKVTSSTNKKQLRENFKALGGAVDEPFTASTISKLAIASELLDVNKAAEIIKATATDQGYEEMTAALYVETVIKVSTRLPLRFDAARIKKEWARASKELDYSSALFDDRGWRDLESTASKLLGMTLVVKRGDGTKFTIERNTIDGKPLPEGPLSLTFTTELKDGKWIVTSVVDQAFLPGPVPVDLAVDLGSIIDFLQSNKGYFKTNDELEGGL